VRRRKKALESRFKNKTIKNLRYKEILRSGLHKRKQKLKAKDRQPKQNSTLKKKIKRRRLRIQRQF
jgi:hypothetical protein